MFAWINIAVNLIMVQAYAREVLNQKDEEKAPALVYRSNSLFEATERLLSALDRLEHSLAHQPRAGADVRTSERQLQVSRRENAALLEEREALNIAVDQLKAQYGDLHSTASGIYNKLEDSIRRLTQIMKE
mgnify:CR=1 FL=1